MALPEITQKSKENSFKYTFQNVSFLIFQFIRFIIYSFFLFVQVKYIFCYISFNQQNNKKKHIIFQSQKNKTLSKSQ